MKKHSFTLTELLMAIGIIVILAAIAIPTTASAIKKAEQAKAKAQMQELINALKNYENTYGSFPFRKLIKAIPGATIQDGTLSDNGQLKAIYDTAYPELIKVLQGQKDVTIGSTTVTVNPRKIQFLDVQGNTEGEFLDPWGNAYYMTFDMDGDGKTKVDKCRPCGLKVEGDIIRTDIIIWSRGPDGKHSNTLGDDSNADNVYSIPVDFDKGDGTFYPSR